MQPIVIYGAGGFAREVLCLLEDINAEAPQWDVAAFVDDRAAEHEREIHGYPVVRAAEWDRRTIRNVVLAAGSPAVKRRMARELEGSDSSFPVLVHPTVTRSKRVELGRGTLVTAGNILTTDIVLREFVTMNLTCTTGHDSRIGRYTTVAPGVNISGNVTLGEGCDIGTGSKLIQGIAIGEWTIVGAGAVVARDLPANCTAVGVPAKVIKERQAGWQE